MKRIFRASSLGFGLALLVAGASVAGLFFFKSSSDQQEKRLLQSDTGQAGLYIGSVFGDLGSSLDSLGTAVKLSNGSTAAFVSQAQPLASEGLNVVLAQRQSAGYVVTSVAGKGFTTGESLKPSVSAVLAAAGANFASSVTYNGKLSTAVFAVGPPSVPPGYAIFMQFAFSPFLASYVTGAKPFDQLKVALHGSPKPSKAHLLVATVPPNQLPLNHGASTNEASVGAQHWALVAEARGPLIGGFARRAPYIILGLGLFVAILMVLTVGIFDRRQRYAEVLVEERTADLQRALVDLRSAQEALIRGERLTALGEMASVVGHELRNPLAAVINALYLLRRQLGEPAADTYEKHLAMAERETNKAAALAEDLTAFVRPREPHKETVDVPSLVEEVVEASPPPSTVTLDVETEPFSVFVDRHQIAEVLTNLVTNAYQAVDGEGTVKITARKGDADAELSVEDSGPGVDADLRERLFEPFFTTKHDGTGLGLAIVQRLVEAHGGTVGFASGPDQQGALVVVRIPAEVSGAAS